jgi:hypothetical protein
MNGLKFLKLTPEGQQNVQIARKEAWIKKKKQAHIWWKVIPDELKSLFCYLIQHHNDSNIAYYIGNWKHSK